MAVSKSPSRSNSPSFPDNRVVVGSSTHQPGPSQQQHSGSASYDGMFPDMLDVMEFESWWTERSPGGGTQRRYILILYFPSESQFQVTMDDSKTPLSLKVVNRYGEPLRAYDLYVGAVIDVLGRPTTLMSASLRTITWLEGHMKRLWKRKVALEEKVNKFRPTPLHALDNGIFRRLKESNPALGGTIPLRKILDVLRTLDDELSLYQ
jgi:hypothetical protein